MAVAERELPPQSEVKQEASESFGSRFGRFLAERINGSLKEIIPGFSKNGMSPEEKDLYRTTLAVRFLTHTEFELTGAGKVIAAKFFAALKERLMEEQEKIYDSLCDEKGNLPSEITEKLASIREAEL